MNGQPSPHVFWQSQGTAGPWPCGGTPVVAMVVESSTGTAPKAGTLA